VAVTGALDLARVRARLASAPDSARLGSIGVGEIVLRRGALESLGGVVERVTQESTAKPRVCILSDATPKTVHGKDLEQAAVVALGPHVPVGVIVVPAGSDGRVHADEATVRAAGDAVGGADCLVSLGSGTVADIGKAIAARLFDLPHVVVQTAASVNGFADDQSVLLVAGVKRTTPTRWADALVIDTDVLAEAPPAMTAAGFGDVMAMFTAPADWYLACLVGADDTWSDTVVDLTRDEGERLLASAGAIGRAEEAALYLLAQVLTLSGLAMGVSGRTAPGSGMEHTVSHLLEMSAHRRGLSDALHGAQVGVASIVAAATWRFVISEVAAGALQRWRLPDPQAAAERIEEAFGWLDPSGAMAEECWREYAQKLARLDRAKEGVARLAPSWADHLARLDSLLADPRTLATALRAAGAPTRFSDLDPAPDPDVVRWAVTNCHLMRDRFTVADLAFLSGSWTEEDVDQVLAMAAAAGGGL
jgi:glycerol-1-phosphate dehydrogenase [NAD(P)+]